MAGHKQTVEKGPEMKPVSVTLPADLLARVDELSKEERRTRSNMLAEIIERYLSAYTTAPAKN